MRCSCFTGLLVLCVLANTPAAAQLTYTNLQVQYDSIWRFKDLALIPVRFINDPPLKMQSSVLQNCISLQESIRSGRAKIKEVLYEDGADVNWLHITNTGKKPLFINSGELLAGGKQDRMVGETKIILPGQSDYVKVYCVEKGRWADKAKAFNHAGSADAGLKKVMDQSRRQADVWKEIERQFNTAGKPSETWPYLKLHGATNIQDSSYLKYFMQKFRQSDSAFAGFLVLSGNRIINCELFAATQLTALNFALMLSSLAYDVGDGEAPAVINEKVKFFMDQLLQSETSQKAFVASRGQMHLYKDKVIHVIAYDAPNP